MECSDKKMCCSGCGSKVCKAIAGVACVLVALIGISGAAALLFFWYDVLFRDSWAYAFPLERAVYVVLAYVALARLMKCGMSGSMGGWMKKMCGMNGSMSGCCKSESGSACKGSSMHVEACKGETCKGEKAM